MKIAKESFGDDNLYSFGALDGKKPVRYTISFDNYSHNMKRLYVLPNLPGWFEVIYHVLEATMKRVGLECFR